MPDLEAQVEGSQIVITQKQPEIVFDLPLTVWRMRRLPGGRRSADSYHRQDNNSGYRRAGSNSAGKNRSRSQYLLQRHLGENVRLRIARAFGENGHSRGQLYSQTEFRYPQRRYWTLDIPMVNGRFSWSWQVDGKKPEDGRQLDGQPLTGVRYVKPEQPVAGAYPK